MNLYCVEAHNLHYTEVISPEIGSVAYTDGSIYEFVYAETAGQAKSMVFKKHQTRYAYLEYTDLKCSLKRGDVNEPAGITDDYSHYIWLRKRPSEEMMHYDYGPFNRFLKHDTPYIWDSALGCMVYEIGSVLTVDEDYRWVVTDIIDFGRDWLMEIDYERIETGEAS